MSPGDAAKGASLLITPLALPPHPAPRGDTHLRSAPMGGHMDTAPPGPWNPGTDPAPSGGAGSRELSSAVTRSGPKAWLKSPGRDTQRGPPKPMTPFPIAVGQDGGGLSHIPPQPPPSQCSPGAGSGLIGAKLVPEGIGMGGSGGETAMPHVSPLPPPFAGTGDRQTWVSPQGGHSQRAVCPHFPLTSAPQGGCSTQNRGGGSHLHIPPPAHGLIQQRGN